MTPISVVYIVKNGGALFAYSLKQVSKWADEIIVVDNRSSDTSVKVARIMGAHVYRSSLSHFGKLREEALSYTTHNWVLILDHDEVPSPMLMKHITRISGNARYMAYNVSFINHLFGKPLKYGGETYSKLIFFHKRHVSLIKSALHEKYVAKKGEIGHLRSPVYHYSYRSVPQIIAKFTDYALRDAKDKFKTHEKPTVKKLFMYGPHMFWERYIKDKGYKDTPTRIFLDGAFAYMEALTYWGLLYYTIVNEIRSRYHRLLHTTG